MSKLVGGNGNIIKTEPIVFRDKTEEDVKQVCQEIEARSSIYEPTGLCRTKMQEELIAEIIPDAENILEIGTGKGGLTAMLAANCSSVDTVGLNLKESETAYLNLASKGLEKKVNFYRFDAGEGIFAEERSYDLVVSSMSFHHFRYPFAVIREMIRVTKKQLIIADFNNAGFAVVRDIHARDGKVHSEEGHDFFIMSPYLAEYGFEVEFKSYPFQDIYVAYRN